MCVVDTSMRFVEYSDLWMNKLNIDVVDIIGKSYYNIIKGTPKELKKIFSTCLKGNSSSSSGHKFIDTEGGTQWFKWDVSPWHLDNGDVGGLIIISENITQEKRQKELQSKAGETAKIGGWEIDLITNNVSWTKMTRKIYEVGDEYDSNDAEGLRFFKEGESRDTVEKAFDEVFATGKSFDIEVLMITGKRREIWVRVIGEAEKANGKVIRIFGVFQDIDEKKRAELIAKEEAEKYARAAEVATVGIWDFNIIEGNLVCDDNMYRLYNLERKDFSSDFEAWQSSIHPEDVMTAFNDLETALKEKKGFETKFRIICPSGEIKHIQAIAAMEKDSEGNPLKLIGTNWDITELREVQLKLHESQETFLGAFENSSVGMALVNVNGDWLKVNDSICKSLGYDEEELLQMNFRELTHPDDIERDLKMVNEVVDGKRNKYQVQKRYFHSNGQIVYVIISVTAVKTIEGKLSHFISQLVDITDQKKAQEKQKELLDITKNQNKSLTNFAHIVSHNLRSHSTNLSMLTGFLQSEEDEEEKKNLTRMLQDSSESLNDTITHLNEVVHVNKDIYSKLEKVNVLETLGSVGKNISALIKEYHVKCLVRVPEAHFVKAVPAYLDSILLNLFTNSIKYRSPDRSPSISVTTIPKGDRMLIIFKDNGLGIDLNRHGKKLFGMYKTFHKNSDAKGIGLFITKNQIEAMNGKIEVESTVGVGTTFTLHFDNI